MVGPAAGRRAECRNYQGGCGRPGGRRGPGRDGPQRRQPLAGTRLGNRRCHIRWTRHTAALEETADSATLRQRIEAGALTHARTAVGNPAMPAQRDMTVTTKRSTRVA